MSNYELVRLDAEGMPMKAIYPTIEHHQVPEMIGELDYEARPLNRFGFNYFGMLRARLLALWGAEVITSSQLGKMLSAVAEGNLGANPFQDSSETEANDETVIEMITTLKEVNAFLLNCDVDWVKPFHNSDGYADERMCRQFAAYLLNAITTLRQETARMLSDEQLDSYEDLVDFLTASPNGIGVL